MSAACHKDRLRVTPPRSRPCLLHHCRSRKDISFAAATNPVPRLLNATCTVHSSNPRASSFIDASHKLELPTAVDGSWSSTHEEESPGCMSREVGAQGSERLKPDDALMVPLHDIVTLVLEVLGDIGTRGPICGTDEPAAFGR
ncbi:uncharacterized protein MYCGRDRAFT_97742 [Zymoseptoria tritici IPO323]|uniref:Uncharacterized protein n=1 Tax=Zymoseptoria tritici (strain CBS 115943 / IPO323) TaxID=336722 RepID=F9XR83_ZYMTI|nr:uncharacterized protein MYCGRDRAFT_97742 [Zymoseptoria tritici IPO323]EGP82213.1 hypothetical protein MYCGRDRAFT_97742 [Zymoseptoria tritici IPO323]